MDEIERLAFHVARIFSKDLGMYTNEQLQILLQQCIKNADCHLMPTAERMAKELSKQ